jgi:prepilin-type N-terminal cleavage/methylation domain-containing protein/prepilin-type processing-associated H-X9-DG protein
MKCRAFTLIELLVVIAIIALLLAIIIPSLQTAKQKASGSVCMSRQRNLVLAYTLYADDNDGNLVNSDTNISGSDTTYWVEPPQTIDGSFSIETIIDRQRGIMRGGLYPYIESIDFYHCPGDRRISNPENDITCAFRSYSIPAGLFSWWASEDNDYSNEWRTDHISYKRLPDIKSTGQAMCFVEEAEMEQGFNHHSWALYVVTDQWYDPLAIFHNDSSTMGFVDGHAASRRWQDPRTIEMFTLGIKGGGTSLPEPDNEDLQWLQARYAYERLK